MAGGNILPAAPKRCLSGAEDFSRDGPVVEPTHTLDETMKPDNHFTRRGMFPWALLPGELRNIIYAYALTTHEAIHMSANRPLHQRGRIRKRRWNWNINHSLTQWRAVPNLLLLDKQTYAEAAPLLYRNLFYLCNPMMLYMFVSSFRPKTLAWIERIFLGEWHLHSYFGWAPRVPNLKRLILGDIGSIRNTRLPGESDIEELPELLLRFHDCREWLLQVGRAEGNPRAGADIVCLGDGLLDHYCHGRMRAASGDGKNSKEADVADAKDVFRRVLGDLLARAAAAPSVK